MFETKSFEKILINNIAPVETIASIILFSIKSTITFFKPALINEPAKSQNNGTVPISEHHIIYFCCPGKVSGLKSHIFVKIDDRR